MECETGGVCPYLEKDSYCQTKSDVFDETVKIMKLFLTPEEEATQVSIVIQNLFGKRYCNNRYDMCLYYQSQQKKNAASESEKY